MSTQNSYNMKVANFIAGGAAGTVGVFFTQPLDVIKTRLQVHLLYFQ